MVSTKRCTAIRMGSESQRLLISASRTSREVAPLRTIVFTAARSARPSPSGRKLVAVGGPVGRIAGMLPLSPGTATLALSSRAHQRCLVMVGTCMGELAVAIGQP